MPSSHDLMPRPTLPRRSFLTAHARGLATITPLRPRINGQRVKALVEFAHDIAIGLRTMTLDGFTLDTDATAELTALLPNLDPAVALSHLVTLVQWCDQVAQFDPENPDARWCAAPGDHQEAEDNLRVAAVEAARADCAAAGAA